MNLPKLVDRGASAKALLDSPLFQEAWELVAKGIHEKWESAPLRDIEGQQILKLQLKSLHDLKAVFELAVTDGNEAMRELDRRNDRQTLSPRQWMNR